MNEDKLSKSALTYASEARNVYENIPEIDLDSIESEAFIGFHNGARWHESLPLADRLSESEKEKIKEIYWRKTIPSMPDINAKYIEQALLEAIFGKNLFTPTEQ